MKIKKAKEISVIRYKINGYWSEIRIDGLIEAYTVDKEYEMEKDYCEECGGRCCHDHANSGLL